jgi:cell division protein FtsA
MAKKRVVTGIDVGTTKVCSTIARVCEESLDVLGAGWSPSLGLRKGVVVNLTDSVRSVKRSLEMAEEEAGSVVESAFVSVGGSFIRSHNCSGQTEIAARNKEVTTEDVLRATRDAIKFDLPEDYQIIHQLTQTFGLDGQNGIVNPLGMTGKKLSVHLHLVINACAAVQNIVNAVNKAGVVVNGVVMQQLASAEAVLTEDEKELGTVLVDIGGGTTDVAVYSQGTIWHSEVLPLGGSLITKDIAIGLKAPLQEAEELKISAGAVFPESVPEEEMIEVEEVGTGRHRTVPRRFLCQVLQARCDEILSALARITSKVGVQSDLVTGVVLTGGGALLNGLVERAEDKLGMPVRLGYPINVAGPNEAVYHPAYSTALGLLRYAGAIQCEGVQNAAISTFMPRPRARAERMKSWLLEKIG